MTMRSYDEYDALADAEAYAKHKKWMPWLAGGFGLIGGVFGYVASATDKPIAATLGFAIGGIVGYVVYRLVLHFSAQATAEAHYTQDWCAHHGLTLIGDGTCPSNGPYYSSGHKQKAWRAIEGPMNGLQVLSYNFSYWTDSTDADGSGSETEHPFRIMRVTGLELPIQRLSIHERGLMNRFELFDKIQASVTPERPVKLESVEFNNKYDLTISDTADDIWIRRIFDPATIAASLAGAIHIPDLKYYDSAWWFVEPGHLKVRELDKLLTWNAEVAPAIQHLARVQNL